MIFFLAKKLLKLLSKLSAKKGYVFLSEANEYDVVRNVDYLSHALRQPKKGGAGVSIYPIRLALNQAMRVAARKKKAGLSLFGFEKWLSENARTVFSVLNEVGDLSDLPHVDGLPRVVILADFIVKYSGGKVRDAMVEKVLAAFQSVTSLNYKEIEALPKAIRYRLLFELSLFAERSVHYYTQYLRAKRKRFSKRFAASDAYLYAYLELLKKPLPAGDLSRDPKTALLGFENLLADDESLVSAYVGSLRESIRTESVGKTVYRSLINAIFSSQAEYREMSDRAKHEYLMRCQKTAEDLSVEESVVARAVLTLGKAHGLHFGEILFYYPRALKRYLKRGEIASLGDEKKKVQGGYAAAVLLLSLTVAAFPAYYLRNLWAYLSVLPLFIASLHPVEYLLKRFLSLRLKPKPLPQMDYAQLPERLKTVVVCSRFVANKKDAEDAVKQASILAAGYVDPQVSYVILADFPSSAKSWSEEDVSLADYLGGLPRSDSVSILIRKRTQKGDRFVARERKRGAILDLFCAMEKGDFSDFYLFGKLPVARYAVLLDDDSEVLPGTIRASILAMAHPLNADYDLLSFGGRINRYSVKTYYAERYLRGCVVDAYPYYSDFYADAFDCSLYCGKAIVRISSYYSKLKDFFPDGRVLSHDLIEGAVLRSGCLKRCVYEDAPATFVGDVTRTARWQRGDVQLLPYSFCNRVKNRFGKRVKNPIAPIYKLILFINGFSVLRDAMILAVITVSLLAGQRYLIFYAVSCLLFTKAYALLDSFRTFFTNVRAGHAAVVCLHAVELLAEELFAAPFRALSGLYLFVVTSVKMAVGSRDLLDWKPFRSTQGAGGAEQGAKLFLPSVILLCAFAIFAGNLWICLYAVAVCLYDLTMLILGRRIRSKPLKEGERAPLLSWAKEIYDYFSEISDDGLPTDNLQLFPYETRSDMTSPTNLGFAFLAEICAKELGFIDLSTCRTRVESLLEKCKKLKKWKGHLYNWYDVKTFAVKAPAVVSTVDSANFVACLIVAERFFEEAGESALAARLADLSEGADFRALYSEEEKAMGIVRYPERENAEGRYDLLASESRLAYCFAIAQGIDPECYFSLGRDCDPMMGNTLLSWSGTAFEYMLPRLFLRAPLGSLIAEQEYRSALVQRSDRIDGVFGRSECGYWEFNDAGAFKYKAIGSGYLALSEESAEVIAPYASFLYLPIAPKSCIENLIRLRKKGMEGEYGFYEAIDYEAGGRVVQSYMTHHQGMSLAAITNALCDDRIVRLFESSPRIGAIRLLQAEENLHTRQPKRVIGEKSTIAERQWVRFDKNAPLGALALRNGEYFSCYDSVGRSRAVFEGKSITKYTEYLTEKGGVFVQIKEGERIFSPTVYPHGDEACFAVFGEEEVRYESPKEGVTMTVCPLDGYDGELRKIELQNPTDRERTAVVSVYADVALNSDDAYDSHPAYSDMFVVAEYDPKNQTEYLSRKNANCEVNITASLSVKGLSDLKANCNSYEVIGRRGNARSDYAKGIEQGGKAALGDVLYPCFGFSGKIFLPPHEKKSVYLVLLAGQTPELLRERNQKIDLAYLGGAIELIGKKEGEENGDLNAFLRVAARLLFSRTPQKALAARYIDRELFLQKGIAPETDILCLDLTERTGRSFLAGAAALSARLDRAGVAHAFVILTEPIVGAGMDGDDLIKKILDEYGAKALIVTGEHRSIFRQAAKVLFPLTDRDQTDFSFDKAAILPKSLQIGAQIYSTGEGGFTQDGYRVEPFDQNTLLPYVNVVGDAFGGFVATESGGGFTFGANSREDKITVWSGDAVRDPRTEELVMEIEGERYLLNGNNCEHRVGSCVYSHAIRGVAVQATLAIAENGKCKIFEVVVAADLPQSAKISLALILALGWRFCDKILVEKTEYGYKLINAVNGKTAYLSCSVACEALTSDQKSDPLIFRTVESFKKGVIRFILSSEEVFPSEEGLVRSRAEAVRRLSKTRIKVDTGKFALDRLYNRILPYQTISCRLNAKSGFYQCSGAVGFRDQLQDCLALLLSDPDRVKAQILLCAEHQYEEGDVQHWWHPPRTGVRTRISDDRLWLVFLTSRYLEVTGDVEILDEKVPFLSSPPLADGEVSRYEIPKVGSFAPLSEHLRRAIDVSLSFGEHGLLKIGGGDWNDGLDRVGLKGRGESVWLSMFAHKVIIDSLNCFDRSVRGKFYAAAESLAKALAPLLKGGRYPLVFTDDGIWLGYSDSPACTIALNPQSWAVLSGAVPDSDARRALREAKALSDEVAEIIKLSAPPFDKNANYGYIASYPKGVRENGGQYTHAAVWYLKALWQCGEKEEGYRVLTMLNPILRAEAPDKAKDYLAEPYVLAGDIYSCDPYRKRAGWTWYTGSAAWLKYTLTEDFFGVKKRGDRLYVSPNFPASFDRASVEIELPHKKIVITYLRGDRAELTLDGKSIEYLSLDEAGEKIELICHFC